MSGKHFTTINFYFSLWIALFLGTWGLFFAEGFQSGIVTSILNIGILVFGGLLLVNPAFLGLEGRLNKALEGLFTLLFFIGVFLTALMIYESGYIGVR